MTARKSFCLASASTQKTYRSFSGLSRRLTKGDRQVSAEAGCVPRAVINIPMPTKKAIIPTIPMRLNMNDLLNRQRIAMCHELHSACVINRKEHINNTEQHIHGEQKMQ